MGVVTAAYQAALAVAGLACLGIVAYALRMEATRGEREVVGLFLAVAAWVGLSLLVTVVAGTPVAKRLFQVQLVGMTLVPPFLLIAALQYTGREQYVNRWAAVALAVQPAFVAVSMQVPSIARHAYRFGPPDASAFYGYELTFGWLLYGNVLWAYIMLGMATGLFLQYAFRTEPVYRRQATALVIAIVVPWTGNALFLLGPVTVDLTALGFTVSGLLVWWTIYRDDFLTVVPVAQSTVVENVDAGVLVVNWRDQVVEVNPRGRKLLGIDGGDVVGRDLAVVLGDCPGVLDAIGNAGEWDGRAEREVRTRSRDLRITATALSDSYDREIGRLVLIDDITGQKRRQRALERQNERLEEFASVVSHDLRNPLSVASGRLELAKATGDDEHIEDAEAALRRIDAIVDDVLALARDGQQVEATDRLSLQTLAEQAWANVDASEATLTVTNDGMLYGDENRLQRALENLFRNAVEHGRADVTITVGPTPEGFFVEDDGPGIPEGDYDEVFDHGFTTNEDGTGLGLPIVRDIVVAHDWTIDVGESERGGARFEIDCRPAGDDDEA